MHFLLVHFDLSEEIACVRAARTELIVLALSVRSISWAPFLNLCKTHLIIDAVHILSHFLVDLCEEITCVRAASSELSVLALSVRRISWAPLPLNLCKIKVRHCFNAMHILLVHLDLSKEIASFWAAFSEFLILLAFTVRSISWALLSKLRQILFFLCKSEKVGKNNKKASCIRTSSKQG